MCQRHMYERIRRKIFYVRLRVGGLGILSMMAFLEFFLSRHYPLFHNIEIKKILIDLIRSFAKFISMIVTTHKSSHLLE